MDDSTEKKSTPDTMPAPEDTQVPTKDEKSERKPKTLKLSPRKKPEASEKSDKAPKAPKPERKPMTPEQKKKLTVGAIAAGLVIIGGVAGAGIHALVSTPATQLTGKVTLSQDDLSGAIGTYTINGQTHKVTARDAILASSSLTKNDDGTYDAPTAESVLTVARNAAMSQAARDRKLTVSDDEIKSYENSSFGTDNEDDIAKLYGYTTDEVHSTIYDSLLLNKLYKDVTGNDGLGAGPSQPTDDLDDAGRAQYIIGLANDAWDAKKGTWADSEAGNGWASAMKAYGDISQGASADAAASAYQYAYGQYQDAMNDSIKTWNDFCDKTYKNLTITCATGLSN